MLRIKFFITCIGDHWETACTLRGHPTHRHANRSLALQQAQADALALWKQQRVASDVLIDEDDGQWHLAASYGELIDSDGGIGWS